MNATYTTHWSASSVCQRPMTTSLNIEIATLADRIIADDVACAAAQFDEEFDLVDSEHTSIIPA